MNDLQYHNEQLVIPSNARNTVIALLLLIFAPLIEDSLLATRYSLLTNDSLLATRCSLLKAQHLENSTTGRIRNTGTIRFRSDTGKYKNDAALANITNNVVEFAGTDNLFTDLNGNTKNTTALGQDPTWRVPGMVRYAKPLPVQQNVQVRWYTNLEMSDSAAKWIPDSVFVGGDYSIFLSGPRTYNGTFFYDGTAPQYVMQERGLSGTVDRYNNMSLLNGPKTVISGMEVRMDGIFINDSASPLSTEGEFHWGSNSFVYAPVTVQAGGKQITGWGVTHLRADVQVANGVFIVRDLADTVIIYPGFTLNTVNDPNANFVMGDSTHLLVLGDFRNQYVPLTNDTFAITSLVDYAGLQDPQIMQATAMSTPYGRLRTANTVKNANGDVYLAADLSVNDTNVVMIPNTLSMTTGAATYTNNSEVIGAMRRDLRTATLGETYVYNNEETRATFTTMPQDFTMDVRPQTRPNDYDNTTDVFRKITITHTSDYKATIRAGYKAEDIPTTWSPSTAERLLKMYNAYPAPNERAIKLNPTTPPTYARRLLAQSTGIAYLELVGIENQGPDNLRLDYGNDLLLRGLRDTLRAVASGRWSNPFTWDEAREPEPDDRVIIDGFTVHTGYVRANDNYTIREAWPDSMAMSVVIGTTPASALLFGYEAPGVWDTFSLVPNSTVRLINQRGAPTLVPVTALDQTAADIDGGLIVYYRSNFSTPNLTLIPGATIINAGTLQVGLP